ncbi:MAG: SGNH/GDSL hydrolase family protein, partial [Clostridia bacterium]|nr:SGNH/GDSL hydrolase family protein [Clostridia bacterium]
MNKKNRILTALAAILLAGVTAVGLMACDTTPDEPDTTDTTVEATAEPTEPETEAPTEPETEAPTEEATTEEVTTEEVTTEAPIKDQLGLNVKDEDLKDIMQNIFGGTRSLKETVMFLDKGEVKSLLYPIKSIVSVTSYDGKTTYEEGKDYVIEDGKLKVTENSSIKVITSEKYYNHPGSLITMNGKPMFWGESQVKAWQVSVTYEHDAAWEGYVQESQLEVYQNFVKKLIAGEDVTVFFYGDSITWGACSTYLEGVEPKQGAYSMLFTEALADLFGYKVKYINTGLQAAMPCHPVPATEYVGGDRGTITYVNTAIGGWNSADGVTNFDKFVKQQVEKYGCDLFVIGYGMNDGGFGAATTKANIKKMIDGMYEIKPEVSVMIVSTMTPHTGSNWDFDAIKQQERQLESLAKQLRKDDKAVAVACVHSVSKAIQEHKTFNDYSGNNINHPNDWFYRVYAQTLLQTLI